MTLCVCLCVYVFLPLGVCRCAFFKVELCVCICVCVCLGPKADRSVLAAKNHGLPKAWRVAWGTKHISVTFPIMQPDQKRLSDTSAKDSWFKGAILFWAMPFPQKKKKNRITVSSCILKMYNLGKVRLTLGIYKITNIIRGLLCLVKNGILGNLLWDFYFCK